MITWRLTSSQATLKITMTTSFRLIAVYAETEIQSLARRHVPSCEVMSLDLDSARPWFVIKTHTDAERDLLAGNEALLKALRAVFQARGCPDEIVQSLTFTFQSEETVARDYAGNWHWALT